MKRHPQDLSETEVRERLCPACCVAFADLAALDFPEPAYIAAGEKFWTFEPVAMWVNARVRVHALSPAQSADTQRLTEIVGLVLWMKGVPDLRKAEAQHLALSALVDMQMQRIYGYGMLTPRTLEQRP